jgi:hypothetical protein
MIAATTKTAKKRIYSSSTSTFRRRAVTGMAFKSPNDARFGRGAFVGIGGTYHPG